MMQEDKLSIPKVWSELGGGGMFLSVEEKDNAVNSGFYFLSPTPKGSTCTKHAFLHYNCGLEI